jgi:hypothetical protein
LEPVAVSRFSNPKKGKVEVNVAFEISVKNSSKIHALLVVNRADFPVQ